MTTLKTGRMLKTGFALAAFVLAAGCASRPHDEDRWPQVPAPAAPAPVYRPPAPQPYQPAPMPMQPSPPVAQQSPAYRPTADDQCGAAALQYLVGRPRTEIPVPLQPSTRRVVCSTCVITRDYRADRQTIVFDSDSGLIKSVGCG